jgi:hypothetical protein
LLGNEKPTETEKLYLSLPAPIVQNGVLLENANASCFVANMPSSEDLKVFQERSTLSGPVINVGFPKAGSSTLYSFFSCGGGWTSTHHNSCGPKKDTYCGLCMLNAIENGLPPISSCSTNHSDPISKQAFLQGDASFGRPRPCFWPHT